MRISLAWIVCGYLLGSIPFAYLAGRLLRKIDIRLYGTRNVGGSNVYENVSKPGIVVVGLLDMAKAGLAYWLGMKMGLGLTVSVAAGIAAIVGHDWPLSLRFHGGRGLSATFGVLVLAFPLGLVWTLFMTALGWLFKNAVLTLDGFITLPALAFTTHQPPEVSWATVVMAILVVVKRLEANREPLPSGRERWRVLVRRLLADRDIDDWQVWAHRVPES